MNKSIYICAAAAMMLASCSNDEVVEQAQENAISFRSMMGTNTRGVVADVSNLNTLCVTAYQGTNLYLDNIIYQKDGTGFFNSAKPYYWPETGELTFTVLSGNWSGTRDFTSSTEQWMRNVTINDDIAKQEDMTYVSNVAGTKAANGKVGVPLEMKHALVQIQLNAKNENSNYVYKVKGIRINRVATNADFDMKKEQWGTAKGEATFEITYDTPIELTSKAQSIMGTAGNAMLIPFYLDAWDGGGKLNAPDLSDNVQVPGYTANPGGFFSVLVNIRMKAGASVYPDKAGGYAWVAIPVYYVWNAQQGKKFTYTLDFSNGAGRVDPVDPGTDWDASKDPAKMHPVLGGLIRFGVTVSEWGTDDKNVDLKDSEKFDVTVDGWTDDTKDAPLK
ncbi:fimbrillin family protein [Bacteroides clarus]|uniref:fimbrillin family protein n=1 Tax=Bacteroides clarus TaxID=626929 RepID=UPI0018AB3BEF|nr:fimbrillin family protein [Bacteroides clarus]